MVKKKKKKSQTELNLICDPFGRIKEEREREREREREKKKRTEKIALIFQTFKCLNVLMKVR